MTDQEPLTILERVHKTTKGNWRAYIEGKNFTSGSSFIMTGTEDEPGEDIEFLGASDADIEFIENAKQDIPRLIDEIYRLKGLIRKLDER